MTNTIQDIVEKINSPFAPEAEETAAQYAVDGAKENGFGFGRNELEVYLDDLKEAGAEFDYSEAYNLACKLAENIEN